VRSEISKHYMERSHNSAVSYVSTRILKAYYCIFSFHVAANDKCSVRPIIQFSAFTDPDAAV